MDQSQPLDLAMTAPGARHIPAIRLLIRDTFSVFKSGGNNDVRTYLYVCRAAQNFWVLNFQWPYLSLAQILNVYQVPGP